jgi:hypothetical protein
MRLIKRRNKILQLTIASRRKGISDSAHTVKLSKVVLELSSSIVATKAALSAHNLGPISGWIFMSRRQFFDAGDSDLKLDEKH